MWRAGETSPAIVVENRELFVGEANEVVKRWANVPLPPPRRCPKCKGIIEVIVFPEQFPFKSKLTAFYVCRKCGKHLF